MPRMRRAGLGLVLSVALAVATAAGCATTLVKKDIQRQSNGWTITFHRLDDGPDSFTTFGATQYSTDSDAHLIWVILSVKNDAPKARVFAFNQCNLRMVSNGVTASYVGLNFGTSAETSEKPELAAGEEITRKLAFVYPEGQVPSRMVCLDQEIVMQ